MIDYFSSDQVKKEIELLLYDFLKKYGFHFFKIEDETPLYMKLFYKNFKNKVLIIQIEPREGERTVDFSIGEYKENKIINVKYLIQAMSEKGADTSRVSEKLKKKKFEKDEWFKDSIEREILFVEEFGDLVL